MNAHKILPVLAAVGLAFGMAGCSSSEPKAASEPAHKIPTAVQMSQEKQAEIIERNVKSAKAYVAKVKAEKEAQAEAEAAADAQAQAQTQAGGNYQGQARSNYQAPRRSGGNYQAPRSGGNSGGGSGGNNWPDYLEIEMPVAQEGEPDPCRWVDTDGNRWTTDHC